MSVCSTTKLGLISAFALEGLLFEELVVEGFLQCVSFILCRARAAISERCAPAIRGRNPRQGGPRAVELRVLFRGASACVCSVFFPSVKFSIFVISGLRVPSCGAPSCVVPSRDAAAVSAAADIKCTYGLGACDCSGGVLGLATTNLQRSTSSSAKKTERNRIKMPRSANEPRKERVFKYAERAKKGVSCLFGLEMHSSQVVVWAQRNIRSARGALCGGHLPVIQFGCWCRRRGHW